MLRFAKLITILLAAAFVAVSARGALSYPLPGIEREGVKEVDKIELFFPRLPQVAELTPDGQVSIDWLTRAAAPPGIVYFGEYLPLAESSGVVFTGSSNEPSGAAAELHRASFDIKNIASSAAGGYKNKDVIAAARFRVES